MILTQQDFTRQFGGEPLPIPDKDWGYDPYPENERDKIIIDLFRRLDQRDFSTVTGNSERWQKGWQENLDQLIKSGPMGLEPKYIRKYLPLRLNGNFIKPRDPDFERNWYEVYRDYLFTTYLNNYDHIFEFGCGSGFNVYKLAQLFPDTLITGLDWAHPSVEIINHLKQNQGLNVKGKFFDFFEPEYAMSFPDKSAVLTMGAMEQTGKDWGKFLEFLLVRKPDIVIHSEPILDFYSNDTVPDMLARYIHTERNFWTGYYEELTKLSAKGKILIIKSHRTGFGSLLLEGYSQLIWRPL